MVAGLTSSGVRRRLLHVLPLVLLIVLLWLVQMRGTGMPAYLPPDHAGWARIEAALWQGPDDARAAPVALPHPIRLTRDAPFTGFYRIALPRLAGVSATQPMALCIPRLSLSARISRKGQILHDTAALGPLQYTRPVLVALGPAGASPPPVDIALTGLPGFDPGLSDFYYGSRDVVGTACERFAEAKREIAYALTLAMLVLGVVAFILFLRLRDMPALWFALTALLWAVHFFFTTNLKPLFGDRAWLMGYYLLRPIYVPFVILFCLSLCNVAWKKTGWCLLAWWVAAALILPFIPLHQWMHWMTVNGLVYMAGIAGALVIVARHSLHHLSFAVSWLVIAFLLIIAGAVLDVLRWIGVAPYGGVSLTYLATPVLLIAFVATMVDRMLQLQRESEHHLANLTQIVAAQRAEIEASYRAMEAERTRRLIHDERQRIVGDMHDGVG